MKTRALPLVVLLVVGGSTLGASATEGTRHRCNPKGSRTVVKNAVARVYTIYGGPGIGREVIGCLYRTGRRTYLGDRHITAGGDGTYVAPVVLNGPYVARNVKDKYHGDQTLYATVAVFDLRSGKRLHRWSQGGTPCGGDTEVTRLVLTHAASAAWLDKEQTSCGPSTQQVFKIEGRAKHPRLLDEATTIDPGFLKLKAGRVYWKNDGAEQSAPIR
jgi:hypothetical protein